MRVALPEIADRALAQLADRERRDPRRQAEVLILRGLEREGVLNAEHRDDRADAEHVERRSRVSAAALTSATRMPIGRLS